MRSRSRTLCAISASVVNTKSARPDRRVSKVRSYVEPVAIPSAIVSALSPLRVRPSCQASCCARAAELWTANTHKTGCNDIAHDNRADSLRAAPKRDHDRIEFWRLFEKLKGQRTRASEHVTVICRVDDREPFGGGDRGTHGR